MGTRTRWIVAAGTVAVTVIILGSAIAQAIRQHSLDPVWSVGWLPAVLIGMYPALTGRGRSAHGRCLPRLRRSAGS
jgi:hypothetical protein